MHLSVCLSLSTFPHYAGWQVTLCDPIWHVSFSSGVATSVSELLYPCYFTFTLLYCRDPDVPWGNGRGWPVVVQYWADLQSVHGFNCYDNIAPNAKCQRVLVLAVCLVVVVVVTPATAWWTRCVCLFVCMLATNITRVL